MTWLIARKMIQMTPKLVMLPFLLTFLGKMEILNENYDKKLMEDHENVLK